LHESEFSTAHFSGWCPAFRWPTLERVFDDLCSAQSGVITRQQLLNRGVSAGAVRAKIRAGHWQRLSRRVYWTFSGPPTRAAQLWAAVLAAGEGAVLSHESAAELCGLIDQPSSTIHVSVPSNRRVCPLPGVRLHVRRLVPRPHSALQPPRTAVEETVVDLTQLAGTSDDAIAWLARAVARRLTTPERLASTIARRTRLRWREALCTAVEDVAAGCHSLLELRYLRDVERAHRLPTGRRQRRRRSTYSDVEYEDYGLNVELDGRIPHEGDAALRDRRRDNRRVAEGLRVLRYGYSDVSFHPCATAGQVSEALTARGWTGRLYRCGPACQLGPTT
jgi:very-short-patch-repair endonuclease